MSDTQHVFELYIRTSPARLWRALTDPEQSQKYYFGTRVQSSFEPGANLEYRTPDDELAIEGKVIEAVEAERVVHTFDFPHNDDPPTRVTYKIEQLDDQLVKLTVIHEGFDGESETWYSVGDGWPKLLDGLKTYLETGEPLEIPPES